ncbi:MAG: TonB-dependent outer membrane protein SusC/RagA [Gemmatimonadetes bacterium]|jgi:TonB-linked SusC/RagA family outer membrane protein|nr:TonB-dependent outer membrane protein SusC/RagA [Gemmatimonadota bacterium]
MPPRVFSTTIRRALPRLGSALALLLVPCLHLAAQGATGTVDGTVLDAGSGRQLPNAQIAVTGGRLGAQTNTRGEYRIIGVPAGPVSLTARLIGYAPVTKRVTVSAGQTIRADFSLAQSAVTLGDVVVTGTGGATEEKKLGNTVAKISMEDLRLAPVTKADEVLQGRIPGVSVLPTGGATGQGARIRIRGSASLSQSNNPIVYIDGVRADNGGGFGNTSAATPSRLNDIDPESIERIEVLKGAAAATLYGTEASNGVIQVFTKKGSAGAPRWTATIERSASSYPTDRLRPNAGYAGCHLLNNVLTNCSVAAAQGQADSLSALYGTTITPYQPFEQNFLPQLFGTGYGNVMSAALSGGAGNITYYTSGRYAYEDGPFSARTFNGNTKDQDRKLQSTLNVELFPRDNLHFGIRSFYADTHNEGISGNNNIYSPNALALYAKPERAYCNDNGGVRHTLDNFAGPGRCARSGNAFGNTSFATVAEALQQSIYQDETHYNAALSGHYAPFTDIMFDAIVGVDNTTARSISFLPFGNAIDNFTANAPDGSRGLDVTTFQNITFDLKTNWNRAFGSRWTSGLVVGAQGFITDSKSQGGSNQNFPGPGLEVVGAGNQPSVYESIVKVVNAGYFAQEQVGLDNWIFVTGGARYDFNSAFGQSAGGVVYPKASISIVPSDRPNWNSSLVSSLRLRAAIGSSGRQPGAFDKFTTYRPLPSQLGGGLFPSNLGNQDLRPEVSTETELGVEAGLFKDRISTSVSYWNRRVTDALINKQFPISGGFTATQLANVGRVDAHGVELSLQSFVVNRKNSSLDVFANGSYIFQNVTSLGGAPPLKAGGSYIRYRNFIKEGYAPGATFGAKLVGSCGQYSAAQAAALRANKAYPMCSNSGELPYDLNKDGKLDTMADVLAYFQTHGSTDPALLAPLRVDEDLNGDFLDHFTGKPTPDWQGGFGGKWRFHSFQLGTLFEYKRGNYMIQDLTDAFRQSSPSIGRNTREAAEVEALLLNPASTPEQRTDAAARWLSLVALSPYDGIVNQMSSGDFVRWRELSLTYNASPSIAQRVGARDMSITLAARNLKLWTGYMGVDPEVNQQGVTNSVGLSNQAALDANFVDGVDAYTLPLQRRFSINVKLGF